MSGYPVEQIPTEKVTWREQERKYFGPEELAEMAATIRVHGILQPIIVFRDADGFIGLAGQRRWMSAQLAGLNKVPAVVRNKPLTETEATEIRLIENTSRESLRPLEQSAGLDEYMKASGLSASEAAKRVGMKPAAVTKSLSLLHLPDSIRQQIDAGQISAGSGYVLARVDDPKAQAELALQVQSGALSRDGLIGKVKALKRGSGHAGTAKTRVTAMLDQQRRVTLCGGGLASVEILIDWLEELLAKARKARPQNLALGTFIKMLRDQAKA